MAPHLTSRLPPLPVFQRLDDSASQDERIALSYRRVKAVAQTYSLTAHDVLHLTPKFWDMHADNIHALDAAVFTLLTIQYNLAAGTLAPYAEKRPELRPLLDSILRFDVSGQYLLTEIGHGLDAAHIETTATLLANGEFDLHTPHLRASKLMPPTGPFGGIPRVAMVMAQLIVHGENHGIRPFVVALGDGKEMCKGVTARLLPHRGGLKIIDHAVTAFDHVRLPSTALLGSLEKPADLRTNFLSCIWRVGVGSMALATLAIPLLAVSTFVAARYSLRRVVTGSDGVSVPIMSFRTQQLPILHAFAQVEVMKAQREHALKLFCDMSLDSRVRSGVAAAAKATMTQHTWLSVADLTERVGAQGLFEHNNIVSSELLMRGIRIAEGDVLVLSIRLANELLLGRYALPKPRHPECLLARHEEGLFAECRALLENVGWNHRHESLARLLLPRCLPLVRAIGHRMAYEAALDLGVDRTLLDLYEVGIILSDSAWYVEHAALPQAEQYKMEDRACTAALPHLDKFLALSEAEPYAARAPILTQDGFESFLNELPLYGGSAELSLIAPPASRPAQAPFVEARL